MEPEEVIQLLMTNTLGESILIETLRSAAYFATRSHNGFKTKSYYYKNYYKESQECYHFIQGTGLDMLIHRFHLDYDPNQIRGCFNYCIRHTT